MSYYKILASVLFSTSLLFAGNTIGLNINSEDFEVEGSLDVNTFSEYTNGTIFVIDGNLINTDSNYLFGIGLSASNSYQSMEGLSLGMGARYVSVDEYSAIPFMFEASYAIPLIDAIPTASFTGTLLYAPSVLSFDEAENYFEFRAEAAMEVISAVSLYVGYRDIEVDTILNKTDTYNSSFYGGMKMSF